ncbi:MAG: hypothetical protein JO107_10270 [Hyphomicrobiales bacterium]|nr:hypothetical protein [Hyphomicrobiales bacterium]MBV8663475.1 hypothetical protein [Hyphomicrobiales bacterium]
MPDPARPVLTLPNKQKPAAAPPELNPPLNAPAAPDEGEDVTYIPGPHDPVEVKWRGHAFKANVPKRVKDAEMIEAARGNRHFRVGAEALDAPNPNEPPKTAMGYRAWALNWMKGVESVDDLVSKWAGDRVLRQTCEVGSDDIAYLGTLIEPKLRALRLREGLDEQGVANIWIKHGVLELPWRA